jgi:hypothetical protein
VKRIKTVETVEEAHLLVSMLESYDIPCDMTNDFIIAVDPLISNAVHGIDTLVDDEYVEDARALLGAFEEGKGDKHCPHCDSANIRTLRLSWWNLILFFGSSMIIPIGRKRMYCQDCLKKFKESDAVITAEEDGLTKEALSHQLEEETLEELPPYLNFISGFFFGGFVCFVLSPIYYLKFHYFPSIEIYFNFALGGGGLSFFLSYVKGKRKRAFESDKNTNSDTT